MAKDTGGRQVYEFGGPAGNILIMTGLPAVVYYLYFAVRFNGGDLLPSGSADYAPFSGFLDSIRPTWEAAAMCASWFLFQALLQRFVPGRRALGARLENGTRLEYRLNGMASFLITLACAGILAATGIVPPDLIYRQFGALISVVMLFVAAFSIFLYVYGRISGQVDRRSGSAVHDFFMGVSLNPRIPPVTGFDLKLFCEARPGLIGWVLIVLSFMGTQYQQHGTVTLPMAMVVFFQFFYVADYFWNEQAILTTTDIVNDTFGFMLAFGDLAWVPFTYSLQAFYLIDHLHSLPWWGAALIAALNFCGYGIFRAVNLQKHRFRTDPSFRIGGREPEYIETERGSRLLVSGFWGMARHFNYVGDIMMALAWCLPCLFGSIVPYFYVIYFTMLLVHRERRDDRHCAAQYGNDWDRYREPVPLRIIPRVY